MLIFNINLCKESMFRLAHEKQLEYDEDRKYSPADITSLFLRYKNNPRDALPNIDKVNMEPIPYQNRLYSEHVLKSQEMHQYFQNMQPMSMMPTGNVMPNINTNLDES